MAKPASPGTIIREVLARTCGREVCDRDRLLGDLHVSSAEHEELLGALELALKCEASDIRLAADLTVRDLIEILQDRAAA